MESTHQILLELYTSWSGEQATSIKPLSSAGSNRKYFRITGKEKTVIGAYNQDIKENEAFFHFTNTFFKNDLTVPELFAIHKDRQVYLQEDLGYSSLFEICMRDKNFSNRTIELYKKSLSELVRFQIIGANKLDFNYCYPRQAMDEQSFLWDLNYFKYYFLKPQNILFNEEKLENDFHNLIKILLEADQNYFVYRDFQARNIMIKDGEPYFIDYQGGRKGALQYDLASILYQVKAQIPEKTKNELIDHYLTELEKHNSFSRDDFFKHFYPYVFIRLLQVMGAYGFRGLIEKRSHFIESIPLAIESMRNTIHKFDFLEHLPELKNCILQLIETSTEEKSQSNLQVQIKSFAYKNGIPKDESGHGEGHVFDCRALPNPGREKQYQHLSGKDESVINYLKEHKEVFLFMDHAFQIVEQSIENYIKRDFSNLNINFGCTGGQHRSVFFAENLAKHLQNKYNINITLTHTNQTNWKTKPTNDEQKNVQNKG